MDSTLSKSSGANGAFGLVIHFLHPSSLAQSTSAKSAQLITVALSLCCMQKNIAPKRCKTLLVATIALRNNGVQLLLDLTKFLAPRG